MIRGASVVCVACMAVLATCVPATPPIPTGEDLDTPWLPFLPRDSHAALIPPSTRPHDAVLEDDVNARTKKVFLSRGWGPGGYDAPPPPPPQRFVRRPLLPPTLGQVNTESPFSPPLALRERAGRARFAALVSTQRQEAPQKPQYRRFHSIFTSGTWSPLGKRGAAPIDGPRLVPTAEEQTDDGDDEVRLVFSKTTPLVIKNRRSGVFASHGWGAGGSPVPTWSPSSPTNGWTDTRHPWLTAALATSDNGSGRGGGGDRYVASFRSGGPMLHHFLSRGWRPMGR